MGAQGAYQFLQDIPPFQMGGNQDSCAERVESTEAASPDHPDKSGWKKY